MLNQSLKPDQILNNLEDIILTDTTGYVEHDDPRLYCRTMRGVRVALNTSVLDADTLNWLVKNDLKLEILEKNQFMEDHRRIAPNETKFFDKHAEAYVEIRRR